MKQANIIYSFLGLAFIAFLFYSVRQDNLYHFHLGEDRPDGFFAYYKNITTSIGKQKSGYLSNYAFKEYIKAKKNAPFQLKNTQAITWVQRGPGNVGGRTRTLILDPDDATGNTWFAGSASGGIWKTSDKGASWQNLTQQIPNLSTTALAIAPLNTSVIYAGTGEGYGGEGMVAGNGIFISVDKGQNWGHISSTENDDRFRYVNKIWVDPSDDSTLVVATNKGIFKSVNAGQTWIDVYTVGYAVQDLVQNPQNENILFAGVNRLGVLKSTDKGATWANSSTGLGECFRVALSISPVDTSYIYAGVEAPSFQTHIYRSTNGGRNWALNYNADGLFIDFQKEQGWFNNIVAAHPFEKDKVYVGGVYLGMLEFKRFTYAGYPGVLRVDTIGTGSYMGFVGFGGSKFEGALATGLDEDADVEEDDFVSVEIRFGKGLSQKAHRFYVPKGQGAGVPPEKYSYQDYVEVPFEVWDIDNNRQLMASFRDQDRNGKFNLVNRPYDDDISGREYIFVSAFDYNPSIPQSEIAQDGGYEKKLIYFMWPFLPDDVSWNPDSLRNSLVRITFGTMAYQDAYTTILADDRLNENLHVDHHDIKFHITSLAEKKFNIIEANDGGLGFSGNEGKTWEQINKGYLTTQFYGVAKYPGKHEYIGGMQDNGTWQSPLDQIAKSNSEYEFQIEGDGFEALWHPWYPQRILGSSYNNYIQVSDDYGKTWEWTIRGINGDGPFITKLSNSNDNPNLVFAVGSRGLYKHENFGLGRYDWESVELGDNWAVQQNVTSSHHVKVSLADPAVVWAGGAMFKDPDLNIFVSRDYGKSFDTATNFIGVELGYISGMATHPTNPAEAFVLFSFKGKPKVIRTMDYGRSWTELSGFGHDSISSNGFPDVMVNDLLVLPTDTNTLWVATEIGLFESADNGATWHIANNGLPPVSIWQLKVADNVVVAATHGRGIWTANLTDVTEVFNTKDDDKIRLYPNPASDVVGLDFTSGYMGQIHLDIYAINGTLMSEFDVKKQDYSVHTDISTGYLSSGNYILSVSYSDQTLSRKLIIQK
jgi:hypothetical protein